MAPSLSCILRRPMWTAPRAQSSQDAVLPACQPPAGIPETGPTALQPHSCEPCWGLLAATALGPTTPRRCSGGLQARGQRSCRGTSWRAAPGRWWVDGAETVCSEHASCRVRVVIRLWGRARAPARGAQGCRGPF